MATDAVTRTQKCHSRQRTPLPGSPCPSSAWSWGWQQEGSVEPALPVPHLGTQLHLGAAQHWPCCSPRLRRAHLSQPAALLLSQDRFGGSPRKRGLQSSRLDQLFQTEKPQCGFFSLQKGREGLPGSTSLIQLQLSV